MNENKNPLIKAPNHSKIPPRIDGPNWKTNLLPSISQALCEQLNSEMRLPTKVLTCAEEPLVVIEQ